MKTTTKIASLLATLTTTFAIGCAAPSDADTSDAPATNDAPVAVVSNDDPNVDAAVDADSVDAKVIGGEIPNFVLGKLADAGWGLLMRKAGLGDSTPDQLDQILAELRAVRAELREAEANIHRAMAQEALWNRINATSDQRAAVLRVMIRYDRVLDVMYEKAAAAKRGDAEGVQAAKYLLEDAVREFVQVYEVDGVMDRAFERLTENMVGTGMGENSFMDAYRLTLRQSSRFLTHEHSQSFRWGYQYMEDFQSLAILLRAECNTAVRNGGPGSEWPSVIGRGTCLTDPRANDGLHDQLEVALQRQHDRLPAVIPQGVVIDQVSHWDRPTSNTHNKPMFMTLDGTYRWNPSDNVNTEGSVPQRMNQNHAGGVPWRMPTDAELAPLFAGARGNLPEHLNGVFRTTDRFAGQSFVWTSNQVTQEMRYLAVWRGEYHEYESILVRTQKGFQVDQNGSRSIGMPVMAHDLTLRTRANAERRRDENFNNQRGGILMTRSTFFTDYM